MPRLNFVLLLLFPIATNRIDWRRRDAVPWSSHQETTDLEEYKIRKLKGNSRRGKLS